MKKILLFLLLLTQLAVFAACGDTTSDNQKQGAGADINIAVLSGPTGVGAVELMYTNDEGKSENHYNFTVCAANDEIVAGLSSGQFDIAAVATNVAANLYNKTNGAVQVCAINTLGVLHILEQGDTVQSLEDLRGRTSYATGQGANPEYVLNYLLAQNGLEVGRDVEVEYMESAALVTKMAAGEVDLCMLPMPAAATVMLQNDNVRKALDLSDEWQKVTDEGELTMGCVVVRRDFVEADPEAVAVFLLEYEESLAAVQVDVENAAELCEKYGIVPKAAVAKAAIPYCNLCCITGADIKPTLEPYYQVLFSANPASVGGAIPNDEFYFIP